MIQHETLSDPLDRASEEESICLREAMDQQAQRSAKEMPKPAEDGLCVDDCGEQVEPARLTLGLGRCLACAQERERVTAHRLKTMGR